MSVIWCGGEDIDFSVGNTPTVNSNSSYFRAGYARCSLTTGDAAGTFISSQLFAGQTSAWLGVQLANAISIGFPGPMVGLASSANSHAGVYIGMASGGYVALYTINASASPTLLATGSTTLPAGQLQRIDMQLVGYGASSTVNIFVNGVQALSFSGSTAISGVSSLNQVCIVTLGGSYLAAAYVSEVIVSSTDSRAILGLLTMAPVATGTTNNWSNNTVTNVNPTTVNNANATYVNTTGQDQQYTLTAEPPGLFVVAALKVAVQAMATAGASSSNIELGVRSAGSVGVNPSHALTAGFLEYEDLFPTNPATGNPWGGASEINALQLDLRSA